MQPAKPARFARPLRLFFPCLVSLVVARRWHTYAYLCHIAVNGFSWWASISARSKGGGERHENKAPKHAHVHRCTHCFRQADACKRKSSLRARCCNPSSPLLYQSVVVFGGQPSGALALKSAACTAACRGYFLPYPDAFRIFIFFVSAGSRWEVDGW